MTLVIAAVAWMYFMGAFVSWALIGEMLPKLTKPHRIAAAIICFVWLPMWTFALAVALCQRLSRAGR